MKRCRPSRILCRVLIGDEAEGKFGRGLRRDHRLGAGSGIAADDAVHLDRRPRPELLENASVRFASGRAQAHLAEKTRRVEAEISAMPRAAPPTALARRRRSREW